MKHAPIIEPFIPITQALQITRDDSVRAGAAGFLRRAAQSLADSGRDDDREDSGQSIDDEIRALSDLFGRKRRWVSVDEVEQVLRDAPAK